MLGRIKEMLRPIGGRTVSTLVSSEEQTGVSARHVERSLLMSADDDPATASERLLDIGLAAAAEARRVDLRWISDRMPPPRYPDVWPGEHYKLLAALVSVLKPAIVVEIGTATGASALAMAAHLPLDGRLVTFDVVPWRDYPEAILTAADLDRYRIRQVVADLSDPQVAAGHAGVLRQADLIFVDAAKDGVMEQRFVSNFEAVGLDRGPVLVFDDIRLWNMLSIWREIRRPKLDLTSFGHWSGTGLVDWDNGGPPAAPRW